MTELLLGLGAAALTACAGLLALGYRDRRRDRAQLEHSLASVALWWWRSDQFGRVVQAGAPEARPPWLAPDALIGRPFWHMPGAPQAPLPAAQQEMLAAGQAFFRLPASVPVPGAPPFGVLLSALPLHSAAGRFIGYAGAACAAGPAAAAGDPARVAQLEGEIAEQSRRFALASREMESFSYTVSHDLRAPLRVVDGFATILLEDYGARLDVLGREHVQRIIAAAARMNAMIDALLALSRRTARELVCEPLDLSRTARELAEELRADEPAREVEFRISPQLHVNGDPVLLRLVLQNLLGNAFKFTAQEPAALIEFGQQVCDGQMAYFVRDNGAGFDMRFADRLFGLFQRLHSQNEFPGTGVGLATVQRIVRRHGGRVWADAAPGKGACFYFTLPGAGATLARDGVQSVGGLDHAR